MKDFLGYVGFAIAFDIILNGGNVIIRIINAVRGFKATERYEDDDEEI